MGRVQKVHAISKLKGQDLERKRLWVNRSLDGIACIYMFVCVVVKLAAQLDCHPKNSEIYISKALVLAIQAIIQPAREARRACALRALGLLLADGTPTVGGG